MPASEVTQIIHNRKGTTVKRTCIALAAAVLAAAPLAGGVLAQEAYGPRPAPPLSQGLPPGGHGIPDLSDQQKEQMRKLRLALEEKTLPLRNQLGEKEAHLRTLMSARAPDADAVGKTAEEIGDLRTQIFKAEVLGDLNVRGLLTEDQKASLDAAPGPRGSVPPPGGEAHPPRR